MYRAVCLDWDQVVPYSATYLCLCPSLGAQYGTPPPSEVCYTYVQLEQNWWIWRSVTCSMLPGERIWCMACVYAGEHRQQSNLHSPESWVDLFLGQISLHQLKRKVHYTDVRKCRATQRNLWSGRALWIYDKVKSNFLQWYFWATSWKFLKWKCFFFYLWRVDNLSMMD